ncbi:MAG: hypothetical protein FWF43_01670 [Propionibacteriaceae bacterium]|nr:hypothetical protein [Propionibacteriaceae bacterium]
MWWSSTYNTYCEVVAWSANSPLWKGHLNASGEPQGTMYRCEVSVAGVLKQAYVWADTGPSTPAKPGVDPVTLVRSAVSSLDLHPPTVGVSAYTYPGYEDWGLSWWVGAPMWLWVDATDPLQWGTHTITASQDSLTVTATVTPSQVSFDPGDANGLVTCKTPGTPRPWDPNDPLSHHSPTGCEHTYLTTNTLGDTTSRYTVSATVSWSVAWSTNDGQSGSFTTTTSSTSNPAIHVGELRVVLTTPGH